METMCLCAYEPLVGKRNDLQVTVNDVQPRGIR